LLNAGLSRQGEHSAAALVKSPRNGNTDISGQDAFAKAGVIRARPDRVSDKLLRIYDFYVISLLF
jgi:hypothetical protein